ncbi:MAG: hypothetical protein ABIA75_08725 [Candidatus Neomarinimicrobiota bacterium]
MKIDRRYYYGLIISMVLFGCGCSNVPVSEHQLALSFDGEAGLEVGGPFIGLAFHHSAMIPQRISFFYPVANSIDHSRDYWTRDTSFVMDWSLKIDDGPATPVGRQGAPFEFTPYAVTFRRAGAGYLIEADYRFCQDKPAAVQTITITNEATIARDFRFDYRLKTGLRTCHTFKIINDGRAEISSDQRTVYTYFDDSDTRQTCVFTANAGVVPVTAEANEEQQTPFSRFVYEKRLEPGAKLEIILIIGSTTTAEGPATVEYLLSNYREEIKRYEQTIEKKIFETWVTRTGNPDTDHSVAWAKAVMEANKHYLDGEFVPMPCPAEYNFYFTHDVLVSDLAAVNYDLARVKEDLDYIIRHADENKIIPHAYYWKDGKYVTEYASSDNWNNFWLILVSAAYLRHSGDADFVSRLYPYIEVSLERSLLTLEDDNLMWSYRPDWWDIGQNYGPRSYMTILAIKALQEYIFLSTALNRNPERVPELAANAAAMETALTEKLWRDDMQYLVNYHDDGSLDEHYYIGSLLGAHFDLLDDEKANALVNTAQAVMVDEKVGIYNAYPMDFERWGEFLKFHGNEVGAKYYYFNGGIWPQGNAWYALALIARDRREEAGRFIDQVMSLHGIMNGPNGQPAYYEVRNANRDNPDEYGRVDKPQFMWAGAWYLYSLYNLFGVRDNGWNIALDPYIPTGQKNNQFSLFVNGNPVVVTVTGRGPALSALKFNGRDQHTLVFPADLTSLKEVNLELGRPHQPYLQKTTAMLESCTGDDRRLHVSLRAFTGHENETEIISPTTPREVRLNGEAGTAFWQAENMKDYYRVAIRFTHRQPVAELEILF